MPIYNYRCKCDLVIQKEFSMTDYPKTIKCDDCGSEARRIITHVPHALFKTTGFTKLSTMQDNPGYVRRKARNKGDK